MSKLEEFEKVCFSCTVPVDKCGERGVECDFNKATKHSVNLRYKQPLRQDFCGFPIREVMTRAEARVISEMSKDKTKEKNSWMRGFR